MVRANTKIGDIFSAKLDTYTKKYLQYVASDLTQLNSDVIRVFKTAYQIDAVPSLSEIVQDEVEFYAHCVTKWGVKLGYWEKVGNSPSIGKVDTLFRSSSDYGNPAIKTSHNWWVWKINEEQKRVGKLEGDNRKAEIGSIIPPDSIVHRMQHGEYDFGYPAFEA